MDEIYTLLQKVNPNIDLKMCDNLINEGFLDSLTIVELIEMIEEQYGIEIDGDDVDPDNFTSVQKIYEMIMKYH